MADPPIKKFKKYRKYIGPSQFGTILGFDEYQTPEALRDEIENGYVPNSTYATQHGITHESVAIYYYTKLRKTNIQKALFMVDDHNPRIGGICDGLIDAETGLEIKCHVKESNLLTKLPPKYLAQVAGYMHLYHRNKWILMSCVFNEDQTLNKYTIFDTHWEDVKDQWKNDWYPKICQYIKDTKWSGCV
jgi:hypothetical protein